jgi:hypothetical protein
MVVKKKKKKNGGKQKSQLMRLRYQVPVTQNEVSIWQ